MRRQLGQGALIVVGGHSRGVGKTTLIEHLLRGMQDEAWLAIKVSAHRHAQAAVSAPLVEEAWQPSPATQTGRYLAAGARRAFLVRAPDAAMSRVAAFIDALRSQGSNVVIESNRIVRYLAPDVLLFVVDPRVDDWKPSSALCLPIADALVWSCSPARFASLRTGDHQTGGRGLFPRTTGIPPLQWRHAEDSSDSKSLKVAQTRPISGEAPALHRRRMLERTDHIMRGFIPLLIVIGALAVAAPVAAQDKIAAGQKVFADNKCSVCHSVNGSGNKKYPLDGAGKKKPEELRAWLTDAKAEAERAGKKLALPMKSYKTLPPADFDALVAYLQSLK